MIACGQLLALPAASPGLNRDCFIGTELENLSGLLVEMLGFNSSEGDLTSLDEGVNYWTSLFVEYCKKALRKILHIGTPAQRFAKH